jgi:hypothetical protein
MQVALLIDGAVFTGLSTEDTISDCKFSIGNEWQASMPAYHQLTNMTSQHVRAYHQLTDVMSQHVRSYHQLTDVTSQHVRAYHN